MILFYYCEAISFNIEDGNFEKLRLSFSNYPDVSIVGGSFREFLIGILHDTNLIDYLFINFDNLKGNITIFGSIFNIA